MVIQIHKKGSKLEVGNYRLISLLSHIDKLLQNLFMTDLNFLEKYNCLYKYQFGFKKSSSTNHALIKITEKIKRALDSRILYIHHEILLIKIEHHVLRNMTKSWFKSYSHNWQQLVSFNETQAMQHRVPQGSVLRPLLFLIYIDDLHVSIFVEQNLPLCG